jgi:hypothetical protein
MSTVSRELFNQVTEKLVQLKELAYALPSHQALVADAMLGIIDPEHDS